MNRRTFLAASAASAAATALGNRLGRGDELPRDVRITRAVAFDVVSRRPKLVGKNSRLDVHGETGTDRMLRLYTNTGLEGLGNCRAGREDVARLLGRNPFDLYDADAARFRGPLGAGTMPLWDLAGKALGKPVWQLLGGAGPQRLGVYDGSIYFADLLPQYADKWQDRFRAEIDLGLKNGHRGFKIKIGRGAKWMPRAEGDARDVAVVKLIRRHAGPDVLLGVDANNGYDLAGAKRFLQRTADARLAFAEEMFPETVQECLAFKEFIRGNGWATLLADGETQGDLQVYRPFIKARAIDVLQGDMNRFGFEGILTEAGWARPQRIQVAPHNWGSLVGFYMQLHVGRAITNFYRAEHDTLSNDVLVAEGYEIREGTATAPDAPGMGLKINEAKFAEAVKLRFDQRA